MPTADNILKNKMEEWPLHYYEIEDISEREHNQLKEQINATQTPGYNPYYDLDNTIFNRYR